MLKSEIAQRLARKLDEAEPALTRLDRYLSGEQPLSFLAPEAKAALGDRLAVMSTNIPRLAVTSLAERLRVTAFDVDGSPGRDLWAAWIRADLDQTAPLVHREALGLGRSFVMVWADRDGRAQVTVESAHAVAVARDPVTRAVTAAVKRWVSDGRAHLVLYGPEEITRYRSDAAVADPAALPATGWSQTGTVRNSLGVVPVVPFTNADRLVDVDGRSEIVDLIPLVDALNKTLSDLLVGSEYFARPRRWATGLELDEDDDGQAVNPIPEGDRTMVNEDPAGRFGSLPAADLGAYDAAVRLLLGQIMAVSALPAHYVGIFTDNPTSADALRAAEASLAARAEARQATFGRAWEQVGRLVVAVERGVDPAGVDVRVRWADPTTRSVAQEADAIVKLHAAGLLPASYALARLGYPEDEISKIRAARRAEALDQAGTDLSGFLP